MTVSQALHNRTIRRIIADIRRRRMVGTYASRHEIRIARWLIAMRYA
jgi:hypothetical protein